MSGLSGAIWVLPLSTVAAVAQDAYSVDPSTIKDIAIWGAVFEGKAYPIN